MPVEQGLPWHPVATGLAGQAIPFIVAASHAHALPSPPFWFPVPAILVASPALLCPSSLFAVLALVPPGVAPVFCVSVLLLPLSVGAPGCPCRAPPPVPPACPPVRGFRISVCTMCSPRLGAREVVVQGERGSLITSIVHFVHNIILPHILEHGLYFMQHIVDDSFMPKNTKPQPIPKPAAKPAPKCTPKRASMSN